MRAVLGLLAVGLCAQATVGELQWSLQGVGPVNQEDDHHVGFANVLQQETQPSNLPQADVVPTGDSELQPFSASEHPDDRQLLDITITFTIWGIKFTITIGFINIDTTITITDSASSRFTTVGGNVKIDSDGNGLLEVEVDDFFLNDDNSDVCDGCTVDVVAGECTAGDCAGYDKDATNGNIRVGLVGDPHMVGLLGQKIDWAGVDSAWYCLLSDGPDFLVNVRLSAPMPKEFPDRQLISAVSVLSDDGRSSLVVEVKNPYSTDTDGCPKDSSVPCLADGGLRILVDGEASAALQVPSDNVHLPGTSPVVVSAANLPAECRPFGGDRVWATQFADMMTNRRSLRSESVSFADWILQPGTLAAPTWCAKYLEEGGVAGLLSTHSEHATLRVETPMAVVRINVGVNYQDLETAPDGTVLVPELEFWQTDLGFDGLRLSDNVAGLMGDTSRFVLDHEGVPVTSGLGALHGPVESYRVAGPFARDFEKLHG